VGAPSDIWSMGVMMYEVLCGAMPFDGETLHAVVIQASVSPHIPVLERRPELDPRLAALVDSCLSKEPEARPRDARALRDLLAPLLNAPEVRVELEKPVPLVARLHNNGTAEEAAGETERMPFAETAISLMPGEDILERARRVRNRARLHGGGAGLWIVVLALLGVGSAGFWWLIVREDMLQAAQPAMAQTPTSEDQQAASKDGRPQRRARKSGASSTPAHDTPAGMARPHQVVLLRDAGADEPSPDASRPASPAPDAGAATGRGAP
jgi:hypothetical protein